ncbi:MAG: hypothetical protein DMG96_41380 [Acidobacteria bacterium]|nr:MAG: hypothetical protein DMG96_41380 [Acidobacteriota bacterium]
MGTAKADGSRILVRQHRKKFIPCDTVHASNYQHSIGVLDPKATHITQQFGFHFTQHSFLINEAA